MRDELLKANFLSPFSSSVLVEKVVISMSWLMGREEMQKCREHLELLGAVAVKSRLQ